MKAHALVFALSVTIASTARAAAIVECGDFNDVAYIPEPIAESYSSFAEGRLRVVTVDNVWRTGERQFPGNNQHR